MSKALPHPDHDQLQLNKLLSCLGDPVRLAIVAKLADAEEAAIELRCRDFSEFGGKSNLAYHFDKLREAGVLSIRLVGTSRYLTLRHDALEARFPGLLTAILHAAEHSSAISHTSLA